MMRINGKSREKVAVDWQDIGEIEEFNNLGAPICKEGGGMKDLKNRLPKMRGTFARLKRIWNSRNITKRTKLRLFNTLVVLVLLYRRETWKMNMGDDQRIDMFHNEWFRRTLKIKWQDHVTTRELLERATKLLSEEVKRRRWKRI